MDIKALIDQLEEQLAKVVELEANLSEAHEVMTEDLVTLRDAIADIEANLEELLENV